MVSLTLYPAQIELTSKPGSTTVTAFTATNNSDTTLFLTPSVSAWQPLGNQGQVSYLDQTPAGFEFTLSNSDRQLNQPFSLAAGQSQQLVLKIRPNSNYSGDLYLTFFVNQTPSPQITEDFTANQNTIRLGAHLLLSYSASTTPDHQLQVTRFFASPKIKDIFTPVNLSATISNPSAFYQPIDGQIEIKKNNLIVGQLTLWPDNVLSQSERLVRCLKNTSEKTTTPSPCFLPAPLWPGRYTAVIHLNNPSPPVEYSFYVLPVSPAIFLLFSFLFLYVFYLLTQHRDKE